MQFGSWQFTKPYKTRNVDIAQDGYALDVRFNDEKYTVLKSLEEPEVWQV